jgi:polyhydroxyalkanoate synthesis regulator phasin
MPLEAVGNYRPRQMIALEQNPAYVHLLYALERRCPHMDNSKILEQIFSLGLDATSIFAGKVQQAVDEWVSNGRLQQDDAKEFVDDLFVRIREEQGNFQDQFRKQLKAALKELEVPTQAEIEALKGRLDRIEYQLRQIQDRR